MSIIVKKHLHLLKMVYNMDFVLDVYLITKQLLLKKIHLLLMNKEMLKAILELIVTMIMKPLVVLFIL